MSKGAIILILVGILIIAKPELIAYVLGVILIIIGGSILFTKMKFSGKQKDNNYFKFGDYKIYKNDKD